MGKPGRKPIAAVLLLVAGMAAGLAQAQTRDEAARRLAGTAAQEWIFVQFRTVMGSSGCSQGEVYRFAADGTLTIEKCSAGKAEKTPGRWSIRERSPIDLDLEIGSATYALLFRKNGGADEMLLRVRPDSKTKPFEERIFRLSKD